MTWQAPISLYGTTYFFAQSNVVSGPDIFTITSSGFTGNDYLDLNIALTGTPNNVSCTTVYRCNIVINGVVYSGYLHIVYTYSG
jgi:hypothetical protein